MAHGNWEVLKCLLMQLDTPAFDIFLHVNAAVKEFPKAALQGCVGCAHLHFVHRVKVGYCDYSMVKAVMSLFQEATACHHDYYHLVSGADLMIKSRIEFLTFFERNAGQEFVGFSSSFQPERVLFRNFFTAWGRQKSPFWSKTFIKLRKWLIAIQRQIRLQKHFPAELTPRKGTDWYSITHRAALLLVEKEPEFRRHFYHAFCPTEFLLQTILGNSDEFRECFYSPNAMENFQCARTIDWLRGQPYIFRQEDFELLVQSPGMFARKFDENVDMRIARQLCEYVCRH